MINASVFSRAARENFIVQTAAKAASNAFTYTMKYPLSAIGTCHIQEHPVPERGPRRARTRVHPQMSLEQEVSTSYAPRLQPVKIRKDSAVSAE